MRKPILLSLAFLFGCMYANARQISPSEAMDFAADFMNSAELRTVGIKTLTPMKAPGVKADAQNSPYYVFNRGEGEGFVIISGDDRAPKILGYSDKGSFDAENLPPQLKAMMEQWAKQMESLPASAERHASWTAAPATRAGEGILMETAEWGQGYPFNAYAPMIEGVQAPAGCVATAMAIAMKYHNWPDYTRGGMQEDFNYPEFTMDFSNYTIDWNVLDDMNNPGFADEVGRLMYSAGVTAQMMYGPYESAAEMWPLGHKMVELYAYAKGCQYIEKKKFDDEVWTAMLNEQLREVGPVIYRGSGSVGHAFVIDGFDGKDLYHVNWGWDGLLNGYYTIDFSNVGGENGSDFSEDQGMIINIKPDKERREYSKMFIPNCDVYIAGAYGCEGWNFMKSDIEPGDRMQIRIPTFTLNGHVGYYDIAIVDEDDNILQILDLEFHNSDPDRHCPYPGQDPVGYVTFPGLKENQRYQLVSMEAPLAPDGWFAVPRSDDPKDWRLVLGGLVYPSYFYDKGNRSEISEVRFHVDETMPVIFPNFLTRDREFTLYKLKGGACSENILIPKKGVTMEITCTDKEGNPEMPLTNGSIDDSGVYGVAISMYSDIFDVWLNYDYDGDTRNDNGIATGSIIEQDGLIYKIEEGGASLIGYENIGSDVCIPASISTGGKELPIVKVENDALLYAPIKNLTINNSAALGVFAFGGMGEIESLSFKGGVPSAAWYCPFNETKVRKVYFDRGDQTMLMNAIMTLNWSWNKELSNATIFNDDIDFYISEVGDNADMNRYMNIYMENIYLYGIEIALREGWIDKAMNSYNIPGIGYEDSSSSFLLGWPVNVREMWKYAIDKKSNKILIEPQIDEIKILSVLVNGQTVESDGNGIYAVPSTEEMTVTVNYILHDRQEMTTVYDANYNNELRSQNLSVDIPVESIQISKTEAELKVGESLTLTATVLPEDATDKTVIWASDNEAVATVDAEGNVTAISLGSATITASCGEVSASSVVTVVPTPAESITLSQTDAQLKVGETLTLIAIVLPENATDETITWTSDNEAVATVDTEGNVTAVSVGNATINASSGEVSASCIVTVNPILVESIQLTPDNWNGEEGESFMIEVVVLPEEATDKSLTWSSSDESIAIVDAEGNVSVLKDGSCVITATASDGSGVVAECVITSAAGVEGIFSDADCLDIFDIKGVQLKKDAGREALKSLTPGIYIVRRGGEMKKVVIR